MEKSKIVETAGRIITESGIEALTIEKLLRRMEADPVQLQTHFKNDQEVISFLLRSLEAEIEMLIQGLEGKELSIEEEFQLFFELVFRLLDQNPFYLSLLFNTEFNKTDENARAVLVQINAAIAAYLTKVITRGKNESVFKTTKPTRTLVNNILGSFRSFMNQQDTLNKMLNDLKKLRGDADPV